MAQQIGLGVRLLPQPLFGSNNDAVENCGFALPVVGGDAISFYLSYPAGATLNFTVDDGNGHSIGLSVVQAAGIPTALGETRNFFIATLPPNLHNSSYGECWQIVVQIYPDGEEEAYTVHSLPIKAVGANADDFAYMMYSCDEDAFGIPFQSIQYNNANSYVQCRMPLHIHKPQFKTEDEVYKTLDGDNMVLYSAFAEEYELETEYIPYEMHKIIIAALSCDHVTIDGISVYKSSSYDIDWDNYILNDCGGKLVKATCKVLVNQRNVNSNVIIRNR